MLTCKICRFDTLLDDVALELPKQGACVCLLCYGREVDNKVVMPKPLRRELTSLLQDIDVSKLTSSNYGFPF